MSEVADASGGVDACDFEHIELDIPLDSLTEEDRAVKEEEQKNPMGDVVDADEDWAIMELNKAAPGEYLSTMRHHYTDSQLKLLVAYWCLWFPEPHANGSVAQTLSPKSAGSCNFLITVNKCDYSIKKITFDQAVKGEFRPLKKYRVSPNSPTKCTHFKGKCLVGNRPSTYVVPISLQAFSRAGHNRCSNAPPSASMHAMSLLRKFWTVRWSCSMPIALHARRRVALSCLTLLNRCRVGLAAFPTRRSRVD
jgi:hypothetical protein